MRLIAVSMIRNEADILPDFLGHCAALFDEVLVVDHASTDGSAEMLAAAAARMPVRRWTFRQRGHLQSLITTALAREAFARGADWVFPLDADEFPGVTRRTALEAMLAGAPPLVSFGWRNLWSGRRGSFAHFAAAGRHEASPRPAGKVALARSLAERAPRFLLTHGSHGCLRRGRAWEGPPPRIGEYLHVPIRHAERFRMKVLRSLAAGAQRPDRQPGQSHQYATAMAHLETLVSTGGEAMLRRFALAYPHMPGGERGVGPVEPLDWAPLGRLEGLPAPIVAVEEVLARDAQIAWAPPPDSPHETWRVRLDGQEAEVEAHPTA